MTDQHKPFVLRVKAHSEVDMMMRAMYGADQTFTDEELVEIGGYSRSAWLMRQFPNWFDNIGVTGGKEAMTLQYIDVVPLVVKPVGVTAAVSVGKQQDDEADDISWPQAPPLIGKMENFRKPRWFETMRQVVRSGRHVSISSPPGVGKDTAVQQLAADEGRPLVTVSGDGGFRRRDLVGTQELQNGSSYFNVAEYAAAVVNGWWVLITEVNAADADALLFINSQLAPPYIINIHGMSYPVHKDFRLFVTYNPGLIGTKPLPPAFKDRFFPIKLGFFNHNELRDRLMAWGLPEDTDPYNWPEQVVTFGIGMWGAHEAGQMRYQVSVRRLIDAIFLITSGTISNTRAALRAAVIDAIDSPIEEKVAERILVGCTRS